MSVLSLLKKVKVQTLSFEKHPCKELDQEVMVHYLNGLALIANEDENVCEKEREYLSILINSFGLSEDMLETFVNFAENPDEKLILDMMQSFATKDIKYNFMVDAMMIASIDGDFDENEEAIIEQYFEMFKITKDEAKDLRYIYEMFYTQNGNALYRYFEKESASKIHLIKAELFEYLLDYYKIDMAYELLKEEKKILSFEFFKPTFEYGSLGDDAKQIITFPVNNIQFCIFLNAIDIKVNNNVKVVTKQESELLVDLDNSDIKYIDNIFVVSSKKESKKVTGITYKAGYLFTSWLSALDKVDYKLTSFSSPLITIRDMYFSNGSSGHYLKLEGFKENSIIDEHCHLETFGRNIVCPSENEERFNAQYENEIEIDYNSKKTSFRFMKSSK